MKFKIISKGAAVFLVSGLLAGCGSQTQETLVSQTKAMQSESVSEAKNVSGTEAAPEESVKAEENGETASRTSPWGGEQDPFTESMAEAGKSVVDALDGNILYISVMNRLSIDCDCDGNPSEPDMHDIGILASTDPVALDQACVDLIYASKDDTASLIERMESRNAIHVLEHGEEIGLGTRTYRLVNCDD